MGWEYRGMRGEGAPPPGLGELGHGTLLVIGGARCVWDDLGAFMRCPVYDVQRQLFKWRHGKNGTIMAVNEIGAYIHAEVDHWASLHTEHLLHRAKWRTMMGLPPAVVTLHSHKFAHDGGEYKIHHVWPMLNVGSLSGLFAAKVGLIMGFDRIVMAGCPMDRSGMFYDPPGLGSIHGEEHILMAARDEIARNKELKERCFSLSGHTREWFGEPEEVKCAV